VKFPFLNDRQIAEQAGMKLTTVTAIRNRLRREGYFRTVRIPYLERLGGELLSVSRIRLNPLRPKEQMQRTLREAAGAADEVFWAVADQFGMLAFSFSRNYTGAWSDAERLQQMLAERGALDPGLHRQEVWLFPLDQTRFLRFFDFSRFLGMRFGLEPPEAASVPGTRAETAPPRRLTRLEKKVYLGLARHPELSDNGVARKSGVARQSVSKLRKRFETERLVAPAQVPDILKTGDEMMTVAFYEFAPGVSLAMRRKGMDWSMRELGAFVQLAGFHDGMVILLERRFEDLQRHLAESMRFYLEKGYLRQPPRVICLATRDIIIAKDLSFGPAVKKILGVEDRTK